MSRIKAMLLMGHLALGMATSAAQAAGDTGPAKVLQVQDPVSLGRLFLTPEQRREIDSAGGGRSVAGSSGTSKLDGVMRRSDGRTVIWVDGVPQFEAGANNTTNPARAPR
jgi:hypothetical protein